MAIGAPPTSRAVRYHFITDLSCALRPTVLLIKRHEDSCPNNSNDNLTIQLARVEATPEPLVSEVQQRLTELPPPPALQPRMVFEGYTIVRPLHSSHRSHIFLALDCASHESVAIKTPSVDLQSDPKQLVSIILSARLV